MKPNHNSNEILNVANFPVRTRKLHKKDNYMGLHLHMHIGFQDFSEALLLHIPPRTPSKETL